MFAKAQKNAQNATSIALTIEEFTRAHADKDISMIKSPWCNENDCEKNLRDKVDDRTKVLCIVEETLEHKVACFACGRDAVTWAFFGRTF